MTGSFRVAALCLTFLPQWSNSAEWFVAPDAAAIGKGTKDSPWELSAAIDGQQKVSPGDTIWLRGGTCGRLIPIARIDFETKFKICPASNARIDVPLDLLGRHSFFCTNHHQLYTQGRKATLAA